MPFPVKKYIAFFILLSLIISAPGAGAVATAGSVTLPATVSPTITRVVESTMNTGTGDTSIAQDEVSSALSKLIQIYERRVTILQDDVNRLRIENEALKTKLNILSTNSTGAVTTGVTPPTTPSVPSSVVATPKTETEKKYDIIMSNIVTSLPDILKKNNITASGSIGLFEFIEPKNFFISIDDGLNPPGVTAFKSKVLFEYDANLNLKVIGNFSLDYPTSRYVTLSGANPFGGVTRVRVKNPRYLGKLLEEVTPPASTVVSSPNNSVSTGTGSTTSASNPITPVSSTLDTIRKAYEKNKLGDVVQMSTTYLQTNPNNIEVLTMRARSQYIFSKFDEALNDIETIYKVQGANIDCGIVNDGARAEKALKGARGSVFG